MGSMESSLPFPAEEEFGQDDIRPRSNEDPADIALLPSTFDQPDESHAPVESAEDLPDGEDLRGDGGEMESHPDEEEVKLERGSVEDLERTLTKLGSLVGQTSTSESTGENADSEGAPSVPPDTAEQPASSKLKVFRRSDLTYTGRIGEGEFGKVSKGFLQSKTVIEVAVKVLPDYSNCIGQLNALSRLKHRNVVGIIGIMERSNSSDSASKCGPRVILPYFPQGNLLQFLSRRNTPEASCKEQEGSLRTTLVKLLYDVSKGCEYLHGRGIVHGNLAARNILVEKQFGRSATHYNAKVSDYGIIQLAKTKGSGRNYMKADNNLILPFRHAPAELFTSDTKGFTFQSDVWSFGVVMWEVLTRGAMPYGRRKDDSMIVELITSGLTPYAIRPLEGYSLGIIDLLNLTFKLKPEERPTFSGISHRLATELSLVGDAGQIAEGNSENRSVGIGSRTLSRRRGPRSRLTRGRRTASMMSSSAVQSKEESTNSHEAEGGLVNSSMPQRFTQKYESAMGPSPPGSNLEASSLGLLTYEGQIGAGIVEPPPPYTPTPSVRTTTSRSSGRESHRPGPLRPRNVNYDREIDRKTKELERLKVQKLQQEARTTWSKMQSLVCQLTNLATSPGGSGSSGIRNPRTGNGNRQMDFDCGSSSYSSRGASEAGSSSGASRRSRGRGIGRSSSKYTSRGGSLRGLRSAQ